MADTDNIPTPTTGMTGNRSQSICGVIVLAALFALFHFQGNATDISYFGRSAFGWMIRRWDSATVSVADYSHGWLIPVISLYVLFRRRGQLAATPARTWWPGLALVGCGLFMHWLGMRAQQPRISLLSFVVLLWTVPLFLYGKARARLLIFPCAYLILCIPLNFLDVMTFPLRLLSARIAAVLVNGLGIPAVRSGTAIYSAAGGGFNFDVANPCSGIRYLLALTALTAAYANLTERVPWKQWSLFAMSVPLAILGNVLRIVLIAVVAHLISQDAAMGLYHDYSGLIVFGMAIMMMIAAGRALRRLPPRASHLRQTCAMQDSGDS